MEVKYRAWSKKNNIMFNVQELRFVAEEVTLNPILSEVRLNDKYDTFQDFKDVDVLQFTGFFDKVGKEIYNGDILGDWEDTDAGKVQSKNQVFWNEPTGSWHLDNSFYQDKTFSSELWLELNDFEYKVLGNIYENAELIAQT